MTLTVRAEALPGASLRDDVLPEMLDLALRTGCRVELKGNDTSFWVYPGDTPAALKEAFDRLYPASRIVAAHIASPVPR